MVKSADDLIQVKAKGKNKKEIERDLTNLNKAGRSLREFNPLRKVLHHIHANLCVKAFVFVCFSF